MAAVVEMQTRGGKCPFAHIPQKEALPEEKPIPDRLMKSENDRVSAPGGVTPLGEFVHYSFRSLVLNPRFVCAAARSAFQKDNYRFSFYESPLGSEEAAKQLAHDLYQFIKVQDAELRERGFSTFVASFAGPCFPDEDGFEAALWEQLQKLHEIDKEFHAWDESVSADGDDPKFAFSVGGRAFFIVGMHPASSRFTRKFAYPTLVFNAHFQFEDLRQTGKYPTMQKVVRSRDTQLQGDINPNLSDFGDASDARQYSGRAVGSEWKCPFHYTG